MATRNVPEGATVLLGASVVGKMLGVHLVTLWRMCRSGTFPQPIYVGHLRKWPLATVEEWISAQVAKGSPARNVENLPQVDADEQTRGAK